MNFCTKNIFKNYAQLYLFNIMEKNEKESPDEKSKKLVEKRNWISPEITNWENKNIENTGGIGPDGGGLGYL